MTILTIVHKHIFKCLYWIFVTFRVVGRGSNWLTTHWTAEGFEFSRLLYRVLVSESKEASVGKCWRDIFYKYMYPLGVLWAYSKIFTCIKKSPLECCVSFLNKAMSSKLSDMHSCTAHSSTLCYYTILEISWVKTCLLQSLWVVFTVGCPGLYFAIHIHHSVAPQDLMRLQDMREDGLIFSLSVIHF